MRYQVPRLQAHIASSLRRPSTMFNPRYFVIDTATGQAVDEFTSKRAATLTARDMNREES